MSPSQKAQRLFARGLSLLRGKKSPTCLEQPTRFSAHERLLQSPHLAHPLGALPIHSTAAPPSPYRGIQVGFYKEQLAGQEEKRLPPSSGMGLPSACLPSPTEPSWASTLKAPTDCGDEAFLKRPYELYASAHNTEKGEVLYKRGEKGGKKINKYIPSIPVSGVNDLVALPQ